ncbi:MAG: PAS domain S-box protein [Deltaproteobacteria bacterium]|nr:PAS domain S-box protein [Deltaproteobacteria bacterium]
MKAGVGGSDDNSSTAELHEALELPRTLIATSSVGIAVYHESGRCVLANESAARMLGGTREQMLAQNFNQIPSWKYAGIYELALRVLATGQPERIEFHIFTTFGRDVWLDCWFAVLESQEERHLFATLVDITDRVRLESALRASERRYRTVLEQATDGLMMADEDGRLVEANQAACKLLGRSRDTLLSMRVSDLFPKEDLAAHPLRLNEVLGGATIQVERRAIHGEGQLVPMEIGATGIDLEGKRHAVASLRDISERRKLETMRDEFLSVAAHELRTPITVIKTYVQLLERLVPSGQDPVMDRACRALGRQAARMARLVQDLLEVSRVQVGRMQLKRELIDLAALVSRVVDAMQALTATHELGVELTAEPAIDGDPERLEQVVMNLIDNAIRYSPDGGLIRIRLGMHEGEAHLQVQDFGLGIPEGMRERVFERFFRAHAGTRSNYGGMGVGLFVCRSIVELHGGRIWVESKEGEGSTFHVALPLC